MQNVGKSLRLFALAAGISVSAPALAQDDQGDDGFVFGDEDGFVFGEEETQTVATSNAPVARFLQEGLQYYQAGDYESASIFFWRVVNEPDISADAIRPRAQHELARSLAKMGAWQSALIFFDQVIAVGPTHPYFEESASWVLEIAARLPGDVDMLRRVAAFAPVFPDRIEEKYVDDMAFMLGEHFYNVGELDRALQYLRMVPEVSPLYPRALFFSAITHVRQYDAQPAVDDLIALMREVEEGRSRSEDLRALGEIARISMARTFYSTGEYDKAIDYYTQIPQRSRYWLDALFEASWAYFQTDQFNHALGNLHSLNSPFFNDEYYPEAAVLEAVIFFYNCRFDEVRTAIDEFQYVYDPLRDELEETMSGLETNAQYYDFLMDLDAQTERRFDPKLRQIVNAALSDQSIRNALAFIDELDGEIRHLERADAGWTNSDLGVYVLTALQQNRDAAVGQAGQLVRNRLNSILDDLRSKQRDASAILVETDLAEANAVSAELRDELYRGAANDDAVSVSREQMYWTFEGEYWRDELGYYLYHIESACR
ncbi:MAG: tetratricopeptide repeat protein [Myxococcales bacterium]|nr:tetratricopeptide repeat protein [Myxococcales bacterium]MCB9534231.1 tetratricopeptide repeat protein [Myxococcales bacterium]